MTDDRKTDELDQEELAIDQALRQALATGYEPLVAGGKGADAATVREYTELLGLLAYRLPAEAPASHLKPQVLARLTSAPSAGVRSAGLASLSQRELDEVTLFGSGASADSADITLHRPDAEPSSAPPDSVDITLHRPGTVTPEAAATMPAVEQLPTPVPARSSWGSYAMAAVLAVSLVGLGYLGALVRQQSQQIDRLNAQLVASATPEDVTRMQHELATARSRLNMVTTVARKVYPMHRVAHNGSKSRPEGIVYVCGRHQQWYLSLHGLEPPDEGQEYHLWFMTEQGKIDGGALEVRDDTSSEMEALSMPDGTHGFLVTLEATEPTEGPESLTILLGERAINL